MELADLQAYLFTKPRVTEETPFGPDALVYKVKGKMFALVAWNSNPLSISLKCNPAKARALRAEFAAITPGYHLNKEHWNTVSLDGSVPPALVEMMIDDSYALVVRNLPKSERTDLTAPPASRP